MVWGGGLSVSFRREEDCNCSLIIKVCSPVLSLQARLIRQTSFYHSVFRQRILSLQESGGKLWKGHFLSVGIAWEVKAAERKVFDQMEDNLGRPFKIKLLARDVYYHIWDGGQQGAEGWKITVQNTMRMFCYKKKNFVAEKMCHIINDWSVRLYLIKTLSINN